MKKAGRPATGRGKARQLGRVHDPDWEEIQKGASMSGVSFTKWAVALLLKAARKQIKKGQSNE
jgi:hypothetical protein